MQAVGQCHHALFFLVGLAERVAGLLVVVRRDLAVVRLGALQFLLEGREGGFKFVLGHQQLAPCELVPDAFDDGVQIHVEALLLEIPGHAHPDAVADLVLLRLQCRLVLGRGKGRQEGRSHNHDYQAFHRYSFQVVVFRVL